MLLLSESAECQCNSVGISEAIADYRNGAPIKVIKHKYGIGHRTLYRWLGHERRYPAMSAAKRLS
jgi:hypothetical protein